jgi:two-component system sensor histidine kinase PilS (NtrC family)
MVRQHPACTPGIRVTVESTLADADAVIEGDDDLLHRAIANLLLNAVQAVGPDGTVRVAVSRTGAGDPAGAVLVRVDDDGPGIAEAVRDRLFEPFVTSKPGGSGLGLAVVHRAMEAHRGTVQVESLAQGTRFTLSLPSAAAVAADRPERDTPSDVPALDAARAA